MESKRLLIDKYWKKIERMTSENIGKDTGEGALIAYNGQQLFHDTEIIVLPQSNSQEGTMH